MKIACVQMDVTIGAIEANLTKMISRVEVAAEESCDLVIFPECSLTGYCFESLAEAQQFAQPIPGLATERMQSLSTRLNLHIVFGMLESEGDRIYNVACCIGPSGVVGKYRKVHLPKLGVDHFVTPGDRPFEVLDIGQCRVGMLICYDASFPEASRCLMLQGADLIVLPTNWPPGAEPTSEHVINARSSENHIYFA
ncbi:MAG: carbon-nitrogen hydrolase family protein, partial [Planctomycetota bacterium]